MVGEGSILPQNAARSRVSEIMRSDYILLERLLETKNIFYFHNL